MVRPGWDLVEDLQTPVGVAFYGRDTPEPGGAVVGFGQAYHLCISDCGPMIVVHVPTGMNPRLDRLCELPQRRVPDRFTPPIGSYSRRPIVGQQHV